MGETMTQCVAKKVIERIYGHGRGWVFTPIDFGDIGSRTTVAQALLRYRKKGRIRQLCRGIYDYPQIDPQLGKLAPSINRIISALGRRDSVRLQPSGSYAANLLGLTDQVPMKIVLLTDGPARKIRLGNQYIQLKPTTPRNMATAGRISGTVIQALRWLGKRHVDEQITNTLRKNLDADAKQQLMKDIRHAPIWIADVIRSLAGENATQ